MDFTALGIMLSIDLGFSIGTLIVGAEEIFWVWTGFFSVSITFLSSRITFTSDLTFCADARLFIRIFNWSISFLKRSCLSDKVSNFSEEILYAQSYYP